MAGESGSCPPGIPANPALDWGIPGIVPQGYTSLGSSIRTAFHSMARNWQEEFDLVQDLEEAMRLAGHAVEAQGRTLRLTDSGLVLSPELVSIQPLDDGEGSHSTTIIGTHHPECFPGVFEYQHGLATTLREAARQGFEDWIRYDLPAWQDALRLDTRVCHHMLQPCPDPDGGERTRRIVLGPTKFISANPEFAAGDQGHVAGCVCCLLRGLDETLWPLVQGPGFCAIRVLYCRNWPAGSISVDCRINGEPFEKGSLALEKYARSRGGDHFESCKQLILIQDWMAP